MDKEEPIVCILLATYNGEKYISDQLDSLIAQSYSNWRLYMRDDGSSDQTLYLIDKYVANESRMRLVQDNFGNLGSCQNFAGLMHLVGTKYHYFMFCDQDDVWLPFKIESTLSYMLQIERQQKEETPVLVYTNFQYVSTDLKIIKSKNNYQATKVVNLGFNHLLAQNPVYGCTMMLNRRLLETVGAIPVDAENHDFWVALVASAFGKIAYLNKATILYRQHDNNISTNHDNSSLRKRFERNVIQRKIFVDVASKLKMAVAFKAVYLGLLSAGNMKVLNDFISLENNKSIFSLLKNILNGVRRQTFAQTFLFYLSVMIIKKGTCNSTVSLKKI